MNPEITCNHQSNSPVNIYFPHKLKQHPLLRVQSPRHTDSTGNVTLRGCLNKHRPSAK